MKHLNPLIPAAALSVLLTGCGSVRTQDNAEPAPISTGYVRVPDGADHVVLYSRASTEGDQIALLHQNDPLNIYSLRDGWFFVSAGTDRGYLEGDAVRFSPASVPAVTDTPVGTAPIVTESAGAASVTAVSAPSETEPLSPPVLQTDPAKPGEIFISEEDVLKYCGYGALAYKDHVYFSVFDNFDVSGDGVTAELQTETITVDGVDYKAQKGIKIHYTPGQQTYFHIEGWLWLYRWEWKDQPGGDIYAAQDSHVPIYIDQIVS